MWHCNLSKGLTKLGEVLKLQTWATRIYQRYHAENANSWNSFIDPVAIDWSMTAEGPLILQFPKGKWPDHWIYGELLILAGLSRFALAAGCQEEGAAISKEAEDRFCHWKYSGGKILRNAGAFCILLLFPSCFAHDFTPKGRYLHANLREPRSHR